MAEEVQQGTAVQGGETGTGSAGQPAPSAPVPGQFVFNPGPVTGQPDKNGIKLDFNLGARIQMPPGKDYVLQFTDLDTDTIIYRGIAKANTGIASEKRYYIRWRVQVFDGETCILSHDYDAKGKNVWIDLPSPALGDTLAMFPYVKLFKEKHGCRKVYVRTTKIMKEFLAPSYPELEFVLSDDERPNDIYASYYVGNFYPSTDRNLQPVSWKISGLQKCAAMILGLPPKDVAPVLKPTNPERTIKEPYVCIAAQATTQCKFWNNPMGWIETVKFLKDTGYRVLCIDKDMCFGQPGFFNTIPYGVENFTGAIPLAERVNLLAHADFFVGLSSGLAWLAYGVGVPVVMISGFTSIWNEFETPYRVINYNVCNSCYSEGNEDFNQRMFEWCPRHQDDPKHRFECTRAISSGHVIRTIKQLMKDKGLDPKKTKVKPQ